MMPKIWYYVLESLLLSALAEPIFCANVEAPRSRRGRSSHVDVGQYISRNMNNFMENSTYNYHMRNIMQQQQQQQQQQQLQQPQQQQRPAEQRQTSKRTSLDETIFSIFRMGNEPGIRLFNSTFDSHLTPGSGMQADQSFIDRSSHKEQAFKVQRTPDGKLNLVFNTYLLFQKTPEPDTSSAARPINPDFVFPDQLNLYGDQHSKCEEGLRDGKLFCTKVSKYPALTDLESILKREFQASFFEDLPQQPDNVTTRMNNEPDEESLCDCVERIIYPEAGLTKDADWLLIVNNNKDFKQGVRIEECSEEKKPCKVLNSLPNHYQAICKQSYIYRHLVAVTNNGTVKKEFFKLPSCCKCVLKQVH